MLSSISLVSWGSSIDSPIIFNMIYQIRLLQHLYQYHLYPRKLSSIDLLTMFRVYFYFFPLLGSIGNSTSYFTCNQVWDGFLGCIQCTSHCCLCSCDEHGSCRVSSEKRSNRVYNSSRSSIPVSSHYKTSTLVYNHNDAAKRAVISAYSLRVNCFNLRNASNT